ncbi:MAG: hypothetical protein J5767_10235 [Paludibacteraceae bacterium]|nr:hypothetical protein [Paludibacteraceae bacterium]
MEAKQKRNRPIRLVLKEYIERQKGKIVDAREELHRRFDGLDWSIQRKILLAHLEASRTEREWACMRLLKLWDDSFLPLVRRIWEEYHDECCSWVVIRYFPKDYIMDQLDFFHFDKNYFHICLRFGKNKEFVIDKRKLTPEDIIYLYYCLELKMESDEAEGLLYKIIINTMSNNGINSCVPVRRNEWLHPTTIYYLNKALNYVKEMRIEPAATSFSQWCDYVAAAVNNSPELKKLRKNRMYDWDFSDKAYQIMFKYICIHFPASVLDVICEKSSLIKELADNFDLEIDSENMYLTME